MTRATSTVASLTVISAAAWGCHSGSPDPIAPVPSGECHIEISNQMVSPIQVSASGRQVRAIGSIPPGGVRRYREECAASPVRVSATVEQNLPGVGTGGSQPFGGNQTLEGYTQVQTATLRPGELARVVFRGRRFRSGVGR